MRRLLACSALLAVWMMTASAATVLHDPAQSTVRTRPVRNRAIPPSTAPIPLPAYVGSELDELIGDTISVGASTHDQQHNSTVGRMIGFDPMGDEGRGVVHVVYAEREGGDRSVRYNRVLFHEDGSMYLDPALGSQGSLVSSGPVAGYTTLAMNAYVDAPLPAVAFHGPNQTSGDEYHVWVGTESPFVTGYFNLFEIDPTREMDWPKSAIDPAGVLHLATQDYNNGDTFYLRLEYDPASSSFSITNPSGGYDEIMTLNAVSYDISASPGGERVAISAAVTRGQFDARYDDSQTDDNDLLIWESSNGGTTWDFNPLSAVNVTQFQGPFEEELPDTLAANGDTLRLWIDSHVYLDDAGLMHAAFPTSIYYYIQNSGIVQSRLFYWNEEDQLYIQLADGTFFNNTNPGLNNLMVDRPNLYKDPDSGWLWCIYRQMGVPGDTLDDGSCADAGSTGYPNSEIFITGSPPGEFNGRLWYTGINLTDSRGTTGNLDVGESRSERDPSIALNNDGDYLNIFYVLDRDGGSSLNDEGAETDNPLVVHRVSKQELIDIFTARPAEDRYVPAYPMHVDSTGFWEYSTAVDEKDKPLLPGCFSLDAVAPNPFNAMTRIKFTLRDQGKVRLVVYDLLGREVATLLDRKVETGHHQVAFNASGLSSGIYFVALESGGVREVRKVALVR